MGGISEFRHFVDHSSHGRLIVRAHTHVNLLGWVEMAIFASVYYIIPRIVRRPIYSIGLVKAHFWIHNIGLIGMVVFFSIAGVAGSTVEAAASAEAVVAPLLATMGIFGSLVLLANFIWAFNIFRTCKGWEKNDA